MIISRTPLRISFAGGGTDLKGYYRRGFGAVTSTALNKYIYVVVNKKFDDRIRLSYSKTEIVDDIDDLKHDLIRETLKFTGIRSGVEIVTVADIPSGGTGLGSSSSLTVGLLNALWSYKGIHSNPEKLAEQACKIEIDLLKEPIGKQDQYIAAFGGLNFIKFNKDESVKVEKIRCDTKIKESFMKNIMLFYTGITRKTSSILMEQRKKIPHKLNILDQIRNQALDVKNCLIAGKIDHIGKILNETWELKKCLSSNISNSQIDIVYNSVLKAGALGGKITGAGGGGFLLLYCPVKSQEPVRKTLKYLKEVKVDFDDYGSKIIYNEG